MTQALIDFAAPRARFNGPVYSPEHDNPRLERQHEKIKTLMLDGQWRTLREIADLTSFSEASISAQLRHMRKPRFGSWNVEKRRRGEASCGLWEYRISATNH